MREHEGGSLLRSPSPFSAKRGKGEVVSASEGGMAAERKLKPEGVY